MSDDIRQAAERLRQVLGPERARRIARQRARKLSWDSRTAALGERELYRSKAAVWGQAAALLPGVDE